jgi:hypothetical protein
MQPVQELIEPKKGLAMPLSEYLLLFSNRGETKVQVKFKNFDGFVATQTMAPSEIVRLVSEENGKFLKTMTFDEWPFEIYRYEIDPIRNTLTIRARKQSA